MNKELQDVYIVDAKRTAIGNFMGSLSAIAAPLLGSCVIKELCRANKIGPNSVSEVIMGQVFCAGEGQNPARQAAMHAGISETTSSYNISQVCGSGLKAIELGAQSIALGKAGIILCGGQENMSRSMHGSYLRQSQKFGDMQMVDLMLKDGLIDAFSGEHMGITAENIADKYNITRKQQDEFAYQSQMKATTAQLEGRFDDEIVPVEVMLRRETMSFCRDEFIKADSNLGKLSKLRPAFKDNGSVTAANSSGINDGAAAVMLGSCQALEQYSLTPIAKIMDSVVCGVDPNYMGTGPIPAILTLLERSKLSVDDIDLFELNEAFAVQSISVLDEVKIPYDKVNINGGAIALGHPIGASGARIMVTLLHSMRRLGKKRGIASLCIGGGMGIAMLVELVE